MTELLTPKEVANILKVNYRKVLDMIALGELRAYRIGRVFRIAESEVYRYLQSVQIETSVFSSHGIN
ncbi:MAG: helix-turn-helix domain-containing protein [Candidatus Marinimicrobia bacterium]|nr:helix-turn-helix domain-containing protein [Candidatus Neomarinimicrobiota bacterium]